MPTGVVHRVRGVNKPSGKYDGGVGQHSKPFVRCRHLQPLSADIIESRGLLQMNEEETRDCGGARLKSLDGRRRAGCWMRREM